MLNNLDMDGSNLYQLFFCEKEDFSWGGGGGGGSGWRYFIHQ